MCSKCNNGNHIICPACAIWVSDRFSVPEDFFKKQFLKKKQKEEEPRDMEKLLNETETGFTQRNFPPGQGTPPKLNSTLVDEEESSTKALPPSLCLRSSEF